MLENFKLTKILRLNGFTKTDVLVFDKCEFDSVKFEYMKSLSKLVVLKAVLSKTMTKFFALNFKYDLPNLSSAVIDKNMMVCTILDKELVCVKVNVQFMETDELVKTYPNLLQISQYIMPILTTQDCNGLIPI